MTKHKAPSKNTTPGPWTVQDGRVMAGDEIVASATCSGDTPLIAAAPDLLAALTKAIGVIELLFSMTGGTPDGPARENYEQMISAIRKARGES